MKKCLLSFIVVLLFTAFVMNDPVDNYEVIDQNSFTKGEVLEYKVKYSFFIVGKAQIKIHDNFYRINGRDCYRVDVYGKTSGAVDWVARVNDNWGAYVDTAALVPHISYRKIEEGSYRKNELIKFDHTTNMIEAKVVDKKTGLFKEPEYIQAPDNIRDIVGGMMYLRSLDFDQYEKEDIITVDAFFEDTVYDFQIIYKGKEEVKTSVGTFNTFKLVPIMPDNKLFAGENPISVWFSDDENQIPIKVEADMVIGKAGCEIINYKGLKNELEVM